MGCSSNVVEGLIFDRIANLLRAKNIDARKLDRYTRLLAERLNGTTERHNACRHILYMVRKLRTLDAKA